MLYLGIIFIAIGTFLIHQSNGLKNSDRINSLEKTLVEKNEKISQQSDLINANITGGDSYCFLNIYAITEDDYIMVLLHEGKYTIKNVVVTITDEQKRIEEYSKMPRNKQMPGKNIINGIEIAKKYTTVYEIGNMTPNHYNKAKAGHINTHLGTLSLEDKNVVYNLLITISADNGLYYQRFKSFKLENGNRVKANQLKNPQGEIIYEDVSKDYPRDNYNEPIW